MAYEAPGHKKVGVEASADLSASQFHAVKMSATGVELAGVGDAISGVLQNKPGALGQAAEVTADGESKAVAGAAVVRGVDLEVDASGRLITAANSGSYIVGEALEAAGADGDIMAVSLLDKGRVA